MGINKREFLKIAGAGLLGVSLRPAKEAIAQAVPQMGPSAQALTGTRWAMVVNQKLCKPDCKDCFIACHRVHNVPTRPDIPRHEMKWIWEEPYEKAFAIPERETGYLEQGLAGKPLIVLCNHCNNPPCVRVCPTQATFKRADGIVMMDFHRCIGCRYCMAACPYGSRSFNYVDPRTILDLKEVNPEFPTRTKGVVEKCNFCNERLAQGLLPACVMACKEKALAFGDLGDPNSEASQLIKTNYTIKRKPELGTMPMVYYVV